MKKVVSLLLCVPFLFLFGCSQNENKNSVSIANSSHNQTSNSGKTSIVSEKAVTIHEGKQLDIELKSSWLRALFNGNLVFNTSKDSGEQTADDTIYLHNLQSKHTDQIGTVKFYNTDSDDLLIMKNSSMYYCPLLLDNKANNALVKADFAAKKVTYEQRYDLKTPLVFFNKINDTEFLINHAASVSDNIWEFYIKKYNIETKKETAILQNRFDKNTQTGTLMPSVCLKDNLIYAYSIKGTSGKRENVIDVYDLNGSLQKSLPIPQLDSILNANKDDSVFKIKTFGNYFYFDTLNQSSILYEYTGTELKLLDVTNLGNLQIVEPSNVPNDQARNRRVYFIKYIEDKAKSIEIFDTSTGKFKSVQLNIDGFQYLRKFVVDENGNIAADLYNTSNTEDEGAKHRYYYIEAEKLLNAQ